MKLKNQRIATAFQSLPQNAAELRALPEASLASPYGPCAPMSKIPGR